MLSIAGSDSGGGAGIQADLKAFAAAGVHGMTAITALTAQNTVGVSAVHPVPGEVILAQVRAVLSDIGIDAVKVGMLGDEPTIRAVAQALDELPPRTPVVVDPVMVSESGATLLERRAYAALVELILPRATVVTPNLPEARTLARAAGGAPAAGGARPTGGGRPTGGAPAAGDPRVARGAPAAGDPRPAEGEPADDAVALARLIRGLGPEVVVVTGGHRETASDVFFDGDQVAEIPGERYPDGAAHGSGCTHSSVLAARLAWGDDPLSAARVAKALAARAVRDGLGEIGVGAGPVNVLGLGHTAA